MSFKRNQIIDPNNNIKTLKYLNSMRRNYLVSTQNKFYCSYLKTLFKYIKTPVKVNCCIFFLKGAAPVNLA